MELFIDPLTGPTTNCMHTRMLLIESMFSPTTSSGRAARMY